ncbi:protein phosphatase 2C domain-containing protein [Rhodocaloribacter litoris]|nr:protein phosphatase 2C domain-containing protein [Rhodocaloribacter litoris]
MRPQVAWLPKDGHAPDEYEDAFAVPEPGTWPYRVAIADGATETAFAARWAQALVEGFVASDVADPQAFTAFVDVQRSVWAAAVAARLPELPWYAAEKAREGAAAAFLGLSLRHDGTWHALAVGDCCLLVVRGGAVHLCWPLDAPGQFHHRPVLVHSRPGTETPVTVRAGTWQPGDRFLLATDALAAWLMQGEAVAGWSGAAFRDRVEAARRQGLRNDDVTLVVIDLDASDAGLEATRID